MIGHKSKSQLSIPGSTICPSPIFAGYGDPWIHRVPCPGVGQSAKAGGRVRLEAPLGARVCVSQVASPGAG